MAADALEPIERWATKRRVALAIGILRARPPWRSRPTSTAWPWQRSTTGGRSLCWVQRTLSEA